MQHMHQQKAHHVTKNTAQATDRISNDIPDGPWIADAEGVHLSEHTVARCGGINNDWFKNLVIVEKRNMVECTVTFKMFEGTRTARSFFLDK